MGSKEAVATNAALYINDQAASFVAYNINGNNYYKLRDLGQAINFAVIWDEYANTIIIDAALDYIP